ncbi:nuclear transport factor 2 family protein [Halostella sp. PRR32]|uniref:nuclear transport factor 2 family protein n=1 Tax=Halostella sp. PRR32 TaxID=3098147 RepID=UPI002B1E4807|nr:nuclear transport factor 2 family protein [Halostella sp. PRR32]
MTDAEETVRSFYAALDDGAYDDLEALLSPEFVQRRPDRTFEGRDAFVSFMRDDRPMTDTVHELRTVFVADGEREVAARGRLETAAERSASNPASKTRQDADTEVLFQFVDVHRFADDGRIERLDTFTQ